MYSQEILKPTNRQINAVDSVVMDMTYPDGEFAGKTVVATRNEIAERLSMYATDDYEMGLALADTIANLPEDKSIWESYGVFSSEEEPNPSEIAGRAIIALAGSNAAIAKAFIQNLTPIEIARIQTSTIKKGLLDIFCSEDFDQQATQALFHGLKDPKPETEGSDESIISFLDANIADNALYSARFKDFLNSAQKDAYIDPSSREEMAKIMFKDVMKQLDISRTIEAAEDLIVDLGISDEKFYGKVDEAENLVENIISNLVSIRGQEPVLSRMLEIKLRRIYVTKFFPKNSRLNMVGERIMLFNSIANLDEIYISSTSSETRAMIIGEIKHIMGRMGALDSKRIDILKKTWDKVFSCSTELTNDPNWIDQVIKTDEKRRNNIDSVNRVLGINYVPKNLADAESGDVSNTITFDIDDIDEFLEDATKYCGLTIDESTELSMMIKYHLLSRDSDAIFDTTKVMWPRDSRERVDPIIELNIHPNGKIQLKYIQRPARSNERGGFLKIPRINGINEFAKVHGYDLEFNGNLPKFTFVFKHSPDKDQNQRLVDLKESHDGQHIGISHDLEESLALFLKVIDRHATPDAVKKALDKAKLLSPNYEPGTTLKDHELHVKIGGLKITIGFKSVTKSDVDFSSQAKTEPNVAVKLRRENLGVFLDEYDITFRVSSSKLTATQKGQILRRMQSFANLTTY